MAMKMKKLLASLALMLLASLTPVPASTGMTCELTGDDGPELLLRRDRGRHGLHPHGRDCFVLLLQLVFRGAGRVTVRRPFRLREMY